MSAPYDCVVIGAGPAGATAARLLAAQRARVLLLDRALFPRHKPCGGGVVIAAAQRLPFSLAPVTERSITAFRVTHRRQGAFSHHFHAPLTLMTQRSRLDAYLVEQALAAGAEFQDGRPVQSVALDNGLVHVRFRGGDSLQARTVVAADGANGIVRRSLGLPPLRQTVALEADSDGVPATWEESVGLDLGCLPGGYGWVFPKADRCNLGVGGWPTTGPRLRRELDAYAASEGFDAASLRGLRGHHLPLRDTGTPAYRGPVAFVGDAAGFIDPLSGEGIGNAIHSASLAAEALGRLLRAEQGDLASYQRAIETQIDPDLAVARQLQALFQQGPWPYVQLLRRSPRFWRTFCRIVRGEASYAGLKERLGPLAPLVDGAAWYAQRGVARRSGWG